MFGKFQIQKSGRRTGPYSRIEMENLYREGTIDRNTPCRLEGEAVWHTVFDVLPKMVRDCDYPEPTPSNFQYFTAPGFDFKTLGLSFLGAIAILVVISLLAAWWYSPRESMFVEKGPSRAQVENQLAPAPTAQPTPRRQPTPIPLPNTWQMEQTQKQMERQMNGLQQTVVGTIGTLILLQFIFITILIVLTIFWVIMLIQAVTWPYTDPDKTTWVLVTILLGPLGAILFYCIRHINRDRILLRFPAPDYY